MGTDRSPAPAPAPAIHELAVDNWLGRYTSPGTRSAYRIALRQWITYCEGADVDPLTAGRLHVEAWARQLEQRRKRSTVATKLHALASFYSCCRIDGLIDHDPMLHVRRPKVAYESTTRGLTRSQFADLLTAAEESSDPHRHALICLLGLNGLRVSEACGIRIEDLTMNRGYHTATVTRKGGKVQTLPMSPRTSWAVEQSRAGRTDGPLLLNTLGRPMDAKAGWRAVRHLGHRARIPFPVHPHMLRHAFVTLSLDAGVSERDIMNSTGHASLKMVAYYDRSRQSLDRNATHALSAYVLGAA